MTSSGLVQRASAGLFTQEPIEARLWPGLNGVRGLAALSVFVLHAVGTNRVTHAGFSGVTVFFVLSGFLLAHLWIHEEDTHDGLIDHRRYFRRRFGRVAPVLIVYVFFAAIIMGVTLAGATGDPTIELEGEIFERPGPEAALVTAAASVGYVLNLIAAAGWVYHGNMGHLWTVSLEMQFYLLLPVLFFVAHRFSSDSRLLLLRICLVGFVLSTAARWYFAQYSVDGLREAQRAYVGFDARIDALLLGVAVAVVLHRRGRLRRPGRALGLGTTMLVLSTIPATALATELSAERNLQVWMQYQSIVAALGSALLIGGIVSRSRSARPVPVIEWRPVLFLGMISYSFYVGHFMLATRAEATSGVLNNTIAFFVMLALTVLGAWISWRLIERPWIEWSTEKKGMPWGLSRLRGSRRTADPAR